AVRAMGHRALKAEAMSHLVVIGLVVLLLVLPGLTGAEAAPPSAASVQVTMIPVGSTPYGVAVDPRTNVIYVANRPSGTGSVIDGATNTVAATVPVGHYPQDVAVDSPTNRVYVANQYSNSVSVIDGVSNTVVARVKVGAYPYGVAVNPATDTIYVTN